jgi:hypothetical protein
MTYAAYLASVPPAEILTFRANAEDSIHPTLVASRVEACPHDLTNIDIHPLGNVLAEAIDTGQPLRNNGWHPLRAPVVVDPETVMARAMRLEQACTAAAPQLGGMIGELLSQDIDKVRSIYVYASGRGEAVVSFLSAPLDADRAAKTLVPLLQIV